MLKNPLAVQRCVFDPLVGKIPWRRKWQPLCVLAWEIPWTEDPEWATVHGVAKSQIQLSD